MKNKKGSVSIALIATIVVILGATAAGVGYFALKKTVNKSGVNINKDGSIEVGKDGAQIKVGKDGAQIKVGKDGAQIKVGEDGASVSINEKNNNDKKNESVSTVLIFDASGSMSQHISGGSRIDVAKKSVAKYVKNLKDSVNISVVAYGHKGNSTQAGKKESCEGIEEIYYMGPANASVIDSKVNALKPNGWTPITASLQKAEEILSKSNSKSKSILLLSDGKETCGGDPITYAKKLKTEGITIDVIGLGVDNKTKDQLNSISISGGGKYISANSDKDLFMAVDDMGAKINAGNLSIDLNGNNATIKTGDTKINVNDTKAKIETPNTDIDSDFSSF